jgi:hypothetical protein
MSRTHEELKEMLENGSAHLECGLCDAVYWVDGSDRNSKGDPRLYRLGSCRIDDCSACAEFADLCNLRNEVNVEVKE